jgi:hypothetical protein
MMTKVLLVLVLVMLTLTMMLQTPGVPMQHQDCLMTNIGIWADWLTAMMIMADWMGEAPACQAVQNKGILISFRRSNQ